MPKYSKPWFGILLFCYGCYLTHCAMAGWCLARTNCLLIPEASSLLTVAMVESEIIQIVLCRLLLHSTGYHSRQGTEHSSSSVGHRPDNNLYIK